VSASNVITVTTEWKKPRPSIDHDNEAFFEGLKQHKFLVWKCKSCTCGSAYWPKAYCQTRENEPFAEDMHWVESSGKGKIFAFNIHQMAFNPGFKEEIPYYYALVELDEGPLVSSTLVGDRLPKNIYDIGQRVEVVYEDHPNEGFTIPKFRIID
jgi:uncharacterized OB-fold protein